MNNLSWLEVAKKAVEAYKTYRWYCMAWGRFNRKETKQKLGPAAAKRGLIMAIKAVNHWRKTYLDLMLLEQTLRGTK